MSLAIANRYAHALAEVLTGAKADVAPEAALQQLKDFQSALDASADLRTLFASPSVTHGEKQGLAASIAQRIGLSKSVRNLIFVMLDNRRTALLPEVVEAFELWLDDKRGIARIEVTSAAMLDPTQREAMIAKFRGITGREIEASFAVDDSLLGGAVVRVGSKVYDGSLSSQLETLDKAMSGRQ